MRFSRARIWKYYPPTGVLKPLCLPFFASFRAERAERIDLEVLPAYWGIETAFSHSSILEAVIYLEVLPAYWGIETLL